MAERLEIQDEVDRLERSYLSIPLRREATRSGVAYVVIGLYASMMVALGAVLVARLWGGHDGTTIIDVMVRTSGILGPLTGGVIGFYFGAQERPLEG